MALSGGYSKEIKIPANTLPLDANMQIMAKFEIGDGNFDIEVGVDPDYEALEMKVGSYINAEGKWYVMQRMLSVLFSRWRLLVVMCRLIIL